MATDEIEQLLTCPICLETLHTPKVLLCQHSLCCDCLKRYVFSSGYIEHVTCPSCRFRTPLPDPGGTQGVDGLPTSFILNSLIDAVSSRLTANPRGNRRSPASGSAASAASSGHVDAMACDCCRYESEYVTAVMRCLDCDEYLCDGCVKMHRRNKKSQQDRLVAVDEYLANCSSFSAEGDGGGTPTDDSSSSASVRRSLVACAVHPGFVTSSYCVPCDRLACAACSASGCRSHHRVMIAMAAERARQSLLARRERLERRLVMQHQLATEIEAALGAALDQERSALVDLGRLHEALLTAVREAYAAALARVQAAAQENRAALQAILDRTRPWQVALEGAARSVDELLAEGGPADNDSRLLAAMTGNSVREVLSAAEQQSLPAASYEELRVAVTSAVANRDAVDRELQHAFGLELTISTKQLVAVALATADASSRGTPPLALFGDDGDFLSTTGLAASASPMLPSASLSFADVTPSVDSTVLQQLQRPTSPAAVQRASPTSGSAVEAGSGWLMQAAWSGASFAAAAIASVPAIGSNSPGQPSWSDASLPAANATAASDVGSGSDGPPAWSDTFTTAAAITTALEVSSSLLGQPGWLDARFPAADVTTAPEVGSGSLWQPAWSDASSPATATSTAEDVGSGSRTQSVWSDASFPAAAVALASPTVGPASAAPPSGEEEGLMWRKICDIDTGRSCVRSIAFNVDGKLLAACHDGLKVAVREGISATLLNSDSSLVAVSEGGLIVVVLRVKKELRCYYQGGGGRVGEPKQLWQKTLQFKLVGPLSLATQGDRVVLLVDGAVNVYRLTDGKQLHVYKKAADGTPLFISPSAVALDHRGRIVLVECQGRRIRAIDDQGATVWEHGSGPAAGVAVQGGAEYSALCVDAYGDVYAADALNHRVVVLAAEDRSVHSLRSVHGYIHCPTHLAIYKRTVAVCHTSVHRISVFRLSDSRSPGHRLGDDVAVAPEFTV